LITKVTSASVNEELVEEQPLLAQPKPEEEDEGYKLDLTTEELVALAAEVAGYIRCRKLDEETRKQFVERYKFVATTSLKLIGFDSALQKVPIKMLQPEQTLILGVGILIALAFFLPTGAEAKPVNMETKIQKMEEKKEEKVENKEEKSETKEKKEESKSVEDIMDALAKLKKS
jgi:hypothetical protein